MLLLEFSRVETGWSMLVKNVPLPEIDLEFMPSVECPVEDHTNDLFRGTVSDELRIFRIYRVCP